MIILIHTTTLMTTIMGMTTMTGMGMIMVVTIMMTMTTPPMLPRPGWRLPVG